MTDQELIIGFENGSLRPAEFHHDKHIKLVWLYLNKLTTLRALERFSETLKRFAERYGTLHRYHETITWAYILLINERIARAPTQTWEEFIEANPDLFDWQHSILKTYYTEETLYSNLAKVTFVFPDRHLKD